MIDLFEIEVCINHKPFGSERIIVRKDAPAPKTKYLSLQVCLQNGGYPVIVTSVNGGTIVRIRCSPAKVLQAHNVFGTNNLCSAAVEIICRVLDRLKIPHTPQQISSWKAGEFKVNAVDVTQRFELPPGVCVGHVCQHLLRTMSTTFRPRWLSQGIGIQLAQPNSAATWIIYDKARELADKRRKARKHLMAVAKNQHKAVWDKLIETASASARVELKLPKTYLVARQLDRGSAWSGKSARELYFSELDGLRLGFTDSLTLNEMPESLTGHHALMQAWLLWSHGENLSTLFPRSTLHDRRSKIKEKTGVDILVDSPAVSDLKVSKIITRHNVCRGFPDWADTYPAVAFRPNKTPRI